MRTARSTERNTVEPKIKMSLSHEGRVPWNKGRTGVYSRETLLKMKKPKSEEHKRKMSETRLKKYEGMAKKKVRWFNNEIETNSDRRVAFGEILGTIPSDAYFGLKNGRSYNYIFASKDKEFVERIAGNFAELGIKAKVHRRESGLWYIEVCRRWFEGFLPYLKKEGSNWIFSEEVLDSPFEDFKAAIIRSFTDAEGSATCTVKNGKCYSRHISIYNGVRVLLSQLKVMLSSFGILSRIYLNREKREAEIKNQTVEFSSVYSLLISNHKNLKLFHDLVGFRLTRKMRKLKEMLNSYKNIERQYTVEEYKKVLSLYKKVKNCREVSRRLNVPPQTVQNWALHDVKPRLVKIYLKEGGRL